MRIAIPLAEGKLTAHFGHCRQFALIDADPESGTITDSTLLDAPDHQPGLLPRWLHEKGANTIIAGGMGQRAQNLFQQAGIEVVIGAPVETPDVLVLQYLDGTLASGENICDH